MLFFTHFIQAQEFEKTYQIGIFSDLQKFDNALVEKVKKAWLLSDLNLELVKLPAERSLRDAASGRLDGDIARYSESVENYLDLIQVPIPIKTDRLSIYVPAAKTCFKLNNINKMKPVGVLGIRYFKRIYVLSDVGYEEAANPVLAFKMLASDRVDYTVINQEHAEQLMGLTDIQLKKCFKEPFFSEHLYTYIHAKNISILEQLTEGYREVFNHNK